MAHASGVWTQEYTSKGIPYSFCSCGMVAWGDKCEQGHERGYVYTYKKREKRYSGYSNYQYGLGGFQQSGRA